MASLTKCAVDIGYSNLKLAFGNGHGDCEVQVLPPIAAPLAELHISFKHAMQNHHTAARLDGCESRG